MNLYEDIASGLQEAIDYEKGKGKARTVRMRVEKVEPFTSADVKQIRHMVNMTQRTFAEFMGVSSKTVEAWETGTNKPNKCACRILGMVKKDPQLPQRMRIVE